MTEYSLIFNKVFNPFNLMAPRPSLESIMKNKLVEMQTVAIDSSVNDEDTVIDSDNVQDMVDTTMINTNEPILTSDLGTKVEYIDEISEYIKNDVEQYL